MIGYILGFSAVLGIANRYMEEYAIPGKVMRKVAAGEIHGIRPMSIDVAITPKDIEKLEASGAASVLRQASILCRHLAEAGLIEVCPHCNHVR